MWRVTVLEQHPFMTKSNKLNRENELIDVFNATLNKQRPGHHTRLGNVEYHKQYNQLHKAHRYVDCICQLCGARYRGKCKKTIHQKSNKCRTVVQQKSEQLQQLIEQMELLRDDYIFQFNFNKNKIHLC